MMCFLSSVLSYPWFVWGTLFGLIGLVVFVLLSAGFFCGVDRYCDRKGDRA